MSWDKETEKRLKEDRDNLTGPVSFDKLAAETLAADIDAALKEIRRLQGLAHR